MFARAAYNYVGHGVSRVLHRVSLISNSESWGKSVPNRHLSQQANGSVASRMELSLVPRPSFYGRVEKRVWERG